MLGSSSGYDYHTFWYHFLSSHHRFLLPYTHTIINGRPHSRNSSQGKETGWYSGGYFVFPNIIIPGKIYRIPIYVPRIPQIRILAAAPLYLP